MLSNLSLIRLLGSLATLFKQQKKMSRFKRLFNQVSKLMRWFWKKNSLNPPAIRRFGIVLNIKVFSMRLQYRN